MSNMHLFVLFDVAFDDTIMLGFVNKSWEVIYGNNK